MHIPSGTTGNESLREESSLSDFVNHFNKPTKKYTIFLYEFIDKSSSEKIIQGIPVICFRYTSRPKYVNIPLITCFLRQAYPGGRLSYSAIIIFPEILKK